MKNIGIMSVAWRKSKNAYSAYAQQHMRLINAGVTPSSAYSGVAAAKSATQAASSILTSHVAPQQARK